MKVEAFRKILEAFLAVMRLDLAGAASMFPGCSVFDVHIRAHNT